MMSDKAFIAIFGVFVIIAIIFAIYVGQENPRCLLSADPILCLEVHDGGDS